MPKIFLVKEQKYMTVSTKEWKYLKSTLYGAGDISQRWDFNKSHKGFMMVFLTAYEVNKMLKKVA